MGYLWDREKLVGRAWVCFGIGPYPGCGYNLNESPCGRSLVPRGILGLRLLPGGCERMRYVTLMHVCT